MNALVAMGEKINPESSPEFLKPLMVEAGRIKEMAARTQKTMRLAKKAIERVGDTPRSRTFGRADARGIFFWMGADPLPKMV